MRNRLRHCDPFTLGSTLVLLLALVGLAWILWSAYTCDNRCASYRAVVLYPCKCSAAKTFTPEDGPPDQTQGVEACPK